MNPTNTPGSRRVAAGLLWLLAAGCGAEPGPARRPVSGSVKLDGKPLSDGAITFLPADGGPPAIAELSDGRFSIGRSEGPAPGPYDVEIVAVRPTGKRIRHPDLPSETTEEVHNVVPARYNARTKLRVDVKADDENTFDFNLSSREEPARRRR
jgi:hypothetical protein